MALAPPLDAQVVVRELPERHAYVLGSFKPEESSATCHVSLRTGNTLGSISCACQPCGCWPPGKEGRTELLPLAPPLCNAAGLCIWRELEAGGAVPAAQPHRRHLQLPGEGRRLLRLSHSRAAASRPSSAVHAAGRRCLRSAAAARPPRLLHPPTHAAAFLLGFFPGCALLQEGAQDQIVAIREPSDCEYWVEVATDRVWCAGSPFLVHFCCLPAWLVGFSYVASRRPSKPGFAAWCRLLPWAAVRAAAAPGAVRSHAAACMGERSCCPLLMCSPPKEERHEEL